MLGKKVKLAVLEITNAAFRFSHWQAKVIVNIKIEKKVI